MEPGTREYWSQHTQQHGDTPVLGRYNPAPAASFFCAPHWHDFIEILYVHEGEALVNVGQQEFVVYTGDVICINPNEPHSFHSETPVSFGFIQCQPSLLVLGRVGNPSLLPTLLMHGALLPSLVKRNQPETTRWCQGIQEAVTQIITGDEIAMVQAVSCALNIISEILRYRWVALPSLRDFPEVDLERLYALQHFVHTRYHEHVTLGEAAQSVHVSRPHLCRLVQQWTGRSFFQYLREHRISQAQRLLRTTDLPITRVSADVGYESVTAFDRSFRQVSGVSPSTYRRQTRS